MLRIPFRRLFARQTAVQRFVRALDVSSPPNPLLDEVSQGMPVRETPFVVYSPLDMPLRDLIVDLSVRGKSTDLAANLIHRAVEVIEEQDQGKRRMMKSMLQSEVFRGAQRAFTVEKNFEIFAFFNPKIITEISPKIHPDKAYLITALITQPLLRLVHENRAVYVDPNEVLRICGVAGFKKICDKFAIQVWNLSPRNLDKYLGSFQDFRGHIQHDLVGVWFDIVERIGGVVEFEKPIVPGCRWSAQNVCMQILRKRNETLFREFVSRLPDGPVRTRTIQFCLEKHAITGCAKHPWAVETLHNWMAEPTLLPTKEKQIAPSIVPEHLPLCRNFTVDEGRIFLVDSDPKLTELKKVVFGEGPTRSVAITFPCARVMSLSVVSDSADVNTYIVDLDAVEPVFVQYFLKSVLHAKSIIKIVSSVGFFLRTACDLLGDSQELHFENLIDIRGSRIRKTKARSTSSSDEIETLLRSEGGFSESRTHEGVYESTECFSGRAPVPVLAEQFLGMPLAEPPPQSQIPVRPFGRDMLQWLAVDSAALVAIDREMSSRGILPVEVLSFDPFDE